jgi:hypothetical protein
MAGDTSVHSQLAIMVCLPGGADLAGKPPCRNVVALLGGHGVVQGRDRGLDDLAQQRGLAPTAAQSVSTAPSARSAIFRRSTCASGGSRPSRDST